MKQLILLLIIGLLSLANSRGTGTVSYYISADFTKDTGFAEVRLDCRITKDSGTVMIKMLLNSNVKIKSLEGSFETHFSPFKDSLGYMFTGGDSISIFLPERYSNVKNIYLMFSYDYPVSIKTENIIVLDRGHRWYPYIPDNIASFTIWCNLPGGYMSKSISEMEEYIKPGGGYLHTWKCPYPVFKIPLIIYREYLYSVYDSDFSGKFLTLNYIKNDSVKPDIIIQQAKGVLNFCETYIGKCSYPELTFTELPGLQGMNIGSGLIMAGTDDLKYISSGYYDGLYLTCIQQWFGASVFAKYGSPGFWLMSLSLPHYIRMLYIKESSGEEAFNKELTGRMEKYKSFAGTEADIPIVDIDFINTAEKGQVLYIKGPYIFYKLHQLMGDTSWKSFIRELYAEYAGKVMSLDDFKITIKKYDSSGTIIDAFNTMITTSGLPE